ncbi:PLP-dependent aminotransferase family protein, partial [Anaeromyxobacter sp. PSR-1]|uniref:MocR-like pyridoxine biosynthesis transcription factor PdxR n=1 Tax=Anaeromyxobacter sp. PSR-1 TaxID=1300915 RepID=UPI000750B175
RIRDAILAGALAPGARLPSTRTLARDVGVSRNTVEQAFSQLDAEGLLVRRVGSGSVVALPAHARPAQRLARVQSAGPGDAPRLSHAAARLVAARPRPEPLEVRPLTPCLPALREFPLHAWRRSVARAWRDGAERVLGYAPVEGVAALRRAVQQHLAAARGVRCDWRQVLVYTSTQQALDAAARVLLGPGDAAWLEEPGYAGARAAVEAAGARTVPVPVDAEGLDVAAGEARAPRARLAYVTPSHQYPLGVTLSPARRRALLAWAARAGAWVLEDDYDSEFRYDSRPVACIQSIDEGGRVLHAGTFNKVMFPALRLAFLVVPPPLVDAFAALRAATDGHVAHLTQVAMADFIAAGQLGAHVRRMRSLYAERRDALRDALRREAAGLLEPGPAEAGMHLTARLAPGVDDVAVAALAARRGLDPRALSPMYAAAPGEPGLVLGFSGVEPAALRRAARELARALSDAPARR